MTVWAVIPTIRGREDSLKAVIACYRETRPDVHVHVELGHPTWPAACNAGAAQAMQSGADIVHFGADDLQPRGDWLAPCLPVLERGELPEARVWNYEYRPGEEPWSAGHGEVPGELCAFTRVPILTAEMLFAVGLWPEIPYYADCWVSDAARKHGWPTRVVLGYDFVHYWHQHGRLDDPETLTRSQVLYDEAVRALG